MLYVGLLVLSVVSFLRMRIELMPDITFPTLGLITSYPGASAEEVEQKITRLVESQVSIVRGMKEIQSISKEGISTVRLKFDWGTNLDDAANDVRDRLGILKNFLPEGVDEPTIFRFDLKDLPVLMIGAQAEESYPRLFHILDSEVSDMVKRVPGVGNVFVRGGLVRQVNVNVDRQRLEAHRLTLLDLARSLQANNITLPAGDISVGRTNYLLRVPGEFESLDQIARIPVGYAQGRTLTLDDVAAVEDGHFDEKERVEIKGRTGAIFFIQKRSEANTVEVAAAVKAKLPEIQARLPRDVKLQVLIDNSVNVKRSIYNLREVLWVAVVLIVLVVLLFLRQWRPALIVCTSIPVSLIDSFMIQYFLGYSINSISLLALTIAVGLVVDDAIVVMENQIRHQDELKEPPRIAAVNAAKEVSLAIVASTFTSCIVFLPVVFVGGVAGVLFKSLALVICVTLLLSLFDALTLNPMLGALLLKGAKPSTNGFYARTERWFVALGQSYRSAIGWALDHRKTVLASATVLFFGSAGLVRFVGTEFFPESDQGQLQAEFQLPVGTRVEATHDAMNQFEQVYNTVVKPEWSQNYFWRDGLNPRMGFGGFMGMREDSNIGRFQAVLVEKSERPVGMKEINQKLREASARIPGLTRVNFFAGDFMSRMLLGREKPLAVDVFGYDLGRMHDVARKVESALKTTPGIADASISLDLRRPEYHVVVDRAKAAALGIPVKDVADTFKLGFSQSRASIYRELGEEYDIVIRMREEDRRDEPDLTGLFVRSPGGDLIRLSNLAQFEKTTGPIEIERQDQQRVIHVEANIQGSSIGQLAAKVQEKLDRIPLPPGVVVAIGGSVKEQKESFRLLGLALILGVLLTFMVMAAQFESLRAPFVIMFSVPFGFVGAVWMFLLTGFHLNVSTFIGLIMMVGLVVKNAIVYLDYAMKKEREGLPLREALIEAGRVRLRPILMTACAMIFGLLPMALSTREGSETWQPLSLTVIGGLIVSTAVTLILIPTLYYSISGRKRRSAPTA